MTQVKKRGKRPAQQKSYRATEGQACAFCKRPLSVGEWIVRGRTKEPYHPGCRRLSKMTSRPAPVKIDSPIHLIPRAEESCGTCEQPTAPTDPHRRGVPYHRECLV